MNKALQFEPRKGGNIKMFKKDVVTIRYILIGAFIIFIGFFTVHGAIAQTALNMVIKKPTKTEEAEKKPVTPAGPADEYDRGNPRSSLKGYFKATRDGDYKRAAQYLDTRNLPGWMSYIEVSELARQLKIVFDRTLWGDLELVSDHPAGNREDGLHSIRESIGRIKVGEQSIDIILQRVPREDGIYIWKFSNRTVAEIPGLYRQFGYKPFEEKLSRMFPDFTFLGWQSWQWVMWLVFMGLAYIAALVPTWLLGLSLRHKDTELSNQAALFISGPGRFVLWMLIVYYPVVHIIGLSTTLRAVHRIGTLTIIMVTWTVIRLIDLVFNWWVMRLRKRGQDATTVVLQPVRKIFKIVIAMLAMLLWLDNIGYDISALLAGLGVGGIAIALAAQDTLKNFLGSLMIFLDKPYEVGERIVVQGHDGVVEEIGLRSTKMRLLTGHQTTIPNDEMARIDIENIGRRPHIRRLTNIAIRYDTPLEKIERAVRIIDDLLENHEGMDPEFPPRVYFNEFNRDSLNIIMLYWYHPPAYWDFLAFNQKVNTHIMREFEKEGIKFALPGIRTYLTQDDGQPLHLGITRDLDLTGDSASV
jgi:MscS family membrane protein